MSLNAGRRMSMDTKEHEQATFFNWDGKQVPLSEFITELFEGEKDEKSDSSSKCIKHVKEMYRLYIIIKNMKNQNEQMP